MGTIQAWGIKTKSGKIKPYAFPDKEAALWECRKASKEKVVRVTIEEKP